jgi:hypothetical protein
MCYVLLPLLGTHDSTKLTTSTHTHKGRDCLTDIVPGKCIKRQLECTTASHITSSIRTMKVGSSLVNKNLYQRFLKKYCPNPMAGICYSSSHRRCGRHATRCRQTASWNHHVRERRTQFGRQLQIQVSYYINYNISKLLLDLYSIHFRIELKIN